MECSSPFLAVRRDSVTPASPATTQRRLPPTRRSSASAAAAERRMTQSVFFFGNGTAEGTRDMTSVLGGKGANLAEMTNLGVPVPAGFTIASGECVEYLKT